MDTATKPIVTTTSLSLLLHSAAIAGALLVYERLAMVGQGADQGMQIQLISSVLVSDQQQTEMPKNRAVMTGVSTEQQQQSHLPHLSENTLTEEVVTSLNSAQPVVIEDKPEKSETDRSEQRAEAKQEQLQEKLDVYRDASPAPAIQSSAAAQQQHTILQLLHRRISDNKEYPYLARRQHREGVATVAFVLHPDGRIEDTRLVTSSHTSVLDRAALAAVAQVEPFEAAKDYLETSETFQVDIEFDLL